MKNCRSLISWTDIGIACFVVFGMTVTLAGQTVTFQTIVSFNNAAIPYGAGVLDTGPMALVQGRDGLLYGTTIHGGQFGVGTAFKTTTSGKLKTLHQFGSSATDATYPESGVTLATNGAFYGTSIQGGTGTGTVFKLTSGGTLTVLYNFPNDFNDPPSAHGSEPEAALLQASDGKFYGTNGTGGANGCGTIFKITGAGAITTLYSFPSTPFCTTGGRPGNLIQGTDGNIYGTSWQGLNGVNNGSIFKIDPSGNVSDLYDFQGPPNDGMNPAGGLVQGSDGNFYGTTEYGGATNTGTIFRMTPTGHVTKILDFGTNGIPGNHPRAPLIQATDGNFYGTTETGGNQCSASTTCGTIFRMTRAGVLTTLYEFNYANGNNTGPWGGISPLTQYTDGTFYGVTALGGSGNLQNCSGGYGCGAIYHLTVSGLGPFVVLDPKAAKVGKTVAILGQGFTGTTAVKFNGVAASFSVKTATYLTAIVPAGTTTGFVTVTTPSGTLKSNVPFQVLP